MQWFRNLTTMVKLMTAFALVGLITGFIGWLGVSNMGTMHADTENIYEVQLVPITVLARMRGITYQIPGVMYRAATLQETAQRREALDKAAALHQQLLELNEHFATTIKAEEVNSAYLRFCASERKYFQFQEEKVVKPLLAGRQAEALQGLNDVTPLYENTVKDLNAVIDVKMGIAKHKFAEAQEIYSSTRLVMIGFVVGGMMLGLALGCGIARLITGPLQSTLRVLEDVRRGDLSKRVDYQARDELGRLAEGFNQAIEALCLAKENEREQVRREKNLAEEQGARERQQADELKAKVDALLRTVNAAAQGDLTCEVSVIGTDAIGRMGEGLQSLLKNLRSNIGVIAGNAQALAGASEELSSVSKEMSASAGETAAQANVVSAASDDVARNVQTVAAGTEEMSVSIREIAKNASEAASIAQSAVQVTSTANSAVSKLGESSLEIGKVIKVITSIAEQTNLLALNATIEAARAGEAGKGFAVVANAVKELAKETAKATHEIGQKIAAIQQDSRGAVAAIEQISAVINQVSQISNTIAGAVEEQTATTNEMGRNVAQAAAGCGEITQNITTVAGAASATTEGADNTQQAAAELARMAADLQRFVGQFRYEGDHRNGDSSALFQSRTSRSSRATLNVPGKS